MTIADFDGDLKTDIGVYRFTTGDWIILNSAGGVTTQAWGARTLADLPVPADYDGDGKADIAVYRYTTGEWFIRNSGGGVTVQPWGTWLLGDIPVPGDYDGDGKADIVNDRDAASSRGAADRLEPGYGSARASSS